MQILLFLNFALLTNTEIYFCLLILVIMDRVYTIVKLKEEGVIVVILVIMDMVYTC